MVIKAQSGGYWVQSEQDLFHCSLKTRLKIADDRLRDELKTRRLANLVSVGDRVRFSEADTEIGMIEEILPRRSIFGRQRLNGTPQVIVANIDSLIVIFASRNPQLKPRMLDRFLVVSEAMELDPTICINKIDLVKREKVMPVVDVYRNAGYRVLTTSAVTGEGIDELRDAFKDKISAIAGPSGVGKSTLLNAVQSGLRLRTGDVSDRTGKGKHTTTEVELLKLNFGGYIADTPGIRTLGLYEINPQFLDGCFPEMRPHVPECEYPSCSHFHEPGCAVIRAVEAGTISEMRYDSYLRMKELRGERFDRKGEKRKRRKQEAYYAKG